MLASDQETPMKNGEGEGLGEKVMSAVKEGASSIVKAVSSAGETAVHLAFDVAARWPLDPRLEPAITIEPDQITPIFRAALNQERSNRDPAKHYDPAETQQRQPQSRLAIDHDLDGIVLQVQHRSLCLHVESIQKLAHRGYSF